jgi:PAS domain S-box-containing protein
VKAAYNWRIVMQPNLRRLSIVAGFILLAALLFGNALVTWRALGAQINTGRWVMHTQQVRLELSQLQTLLMDAQNDQQGYLLTGDDRYLTDYELSRSQIGGHIDSLASLTVDNPVQRTNIAELRPLASETLDGFDRTIVLFRSGHPDEAKTSLFSSQQVVTWDRLRSVQDRMRQEEMNLDATRSIAYKRSVVTAGVAIWLATLVGLLGLVALATYILREIKLRENHARELRGSEEWFRVTLSSIGDAVIATDRSGKVVFLNPAAEAITGRTISDAKGKDIAEVFLIFNELTGVPTEDPVKKVLETGAVVGLANHTVLKSKDGRVVPIEDSAASIRDDRGELIGVVLVFRDVTADRKSEEVLRKAEKLAAAARLSATMAHEINNPLAAVTNLVFLAKGNPDTPRAVERQLAQAEHELERVAHITRQTLGFYRESGTPERVDIPALVESVLRIYQNKLVEKDIHVESNVAGCPSVEGLIGELRQAVSNLVANAIDAVNTGGRIIVSAHPAADDPDETVELIVADNGPGISAEHKDRLFEPFFTTKRDVGTGLGLWATKGIVERHGGRIEILPRNGETGAAFAIQLPCAAHEPAVRVD